MDRERLKAIYWYDEDLLGVPYGLVDNVWYEMNRAADKHGIENTPATGLLTVHEKLTILAEEFGEVARACTYDEGSRENRFKELIQVAAMALMWAAAEKEALGG